ncbi:ABC transporter ATP-binding protein [Spirosoma litoris]
MSKAKANTQPDSVISIHGLRKSFGDLHVLRGIDLEVKRGENVAVLGRSGTGKSVLIKIMVGLLKPDAGKVIVLGQDVETLRDKELDAFRQKVGFSFQSSALYDSMSIRENLEFPLVRNVRNLSRAEINEAVEKALADVGLSQTINQMPSELSGGQRKRIGIARTLILKPEIMLYDEPTAGLDPITSIEINNLINDVRERLGATSIIITHDLTCAKTTGDRVAMLLDGKFERVGPFDEVFSDPDERIQQFYNYKFVN